MSTNPHIVYVLGAGTSVHAGYPLVSNFIEILSQQHPNSSYQLQQLFVYVRNLSKKFPNLNIEELIRLACSPHDPDYSGIADLVLTFNDPDRIGEQYVVIPLKFAVVYLLDCIARSTPRTSEVSLLLKKTESTIITFNWDVLVDRVLNEDYGGDWLDIKSNQGTRRQYLKLHGSADCLYCLNCKGPFRVDVTTLVAKWSENNYSCPYCGGIESHGIETDSYASEPLIIGFSGNKKVELARIPHLQMQWNIARQELIACDEIVFVGFSFSSLDIHVLFFLDGVLRMRRKSLCVKVVNPDDSNRFRRDVVTAFGEDSVSDISSNSITFERYGQRVDICFKTVDFGEYVNNL